MKLETLKDKLRNAVNLAEKIAAKNVGQPILSNLLLEANQRLLKIRATNLDLGLTINLPVKTDEEGRVLVPARVLASVLSNLPGEQKIKLATSQQHLVITSNNNSSLIKSLADDDFPVLPQAAGERSLEADAGWWLEGLRAVSYAASLSDIKPEISSIYLHQQAKDWLFVATDSFRLAAKQIPGNEPVAGENGFLIPVKNVPEISRILESVSGGIKIELGKHQLVFHNDWLSLTTRLIDGVFPNYQQIIPTSHQTTVLVSKKDLTDALKLALVFSDRLSQINLRVVVADGLFELSSTQNEVGENTTQLPARLEGEDLSISLNLRYLLEGLASFGGDNLRLGFNGKNKPILVTCDSDTSFRYLIMPLNR